MTFKQKMRIYGNERISNYAKNPYFARKKAIKMPFLSVFIGLISFIIVGIVISLVTVNSLGVFASSTLESNALNEVTKPYNLSHQNVSDEFIESVNKVGEQFFQKTLEDGNDNVVLSPFSYVHSLYALYDLKNDYFKTDDLLYKDGNYKNEMKKALNNIYIKHVDDKRNSIYSNQYLGLFGNKNILNTFSEDYINLLSNNYYGEIYLSGKNNEDTARLVSDYLLKENALQNNNPEWSFADLNIVSGFSFEANWQKTDFKKMVNKYSFVNDDKTVTNDVDYLSAQNTEISIAETDENYFISIPMSHCYDFNIIYSKDTNVVFDGDLLSLHKMEKKQINANVIIPMFSTGYTSDLSNHILDYDVLNTSLYQNTHFELKENGVTALAITGEDASSDIEVIDDYNYNVFINRPFIYSITNNDGVVLIIGQLTNISKEG